MSSTKGPPWRDEGRYASSSTIPAKRSASSQAYDKTPKRSTNAQEEAWVADEDRFVLQQAKKKAALRVKGGRARPIDWLAVTLRFIDATRNPLDDEVGDQELEVVDPEGVFEGLDEEGIRELESEIENYLVLETDRGNRDYWGSLKTICKDRRRKTREEARGTSSVSADIDRLLAPKTHSELETLEKQVKKKLDSDEPIDYDYWEQLLRNLRVWKAKAKLRMVSRDIVNERLRGLCTQQEQAALEVQEQLRSRLGLDQDNSAVVQYDGRLDPQPSLKLLAEEKAFRQIDEKEFLAGIVRERKRILKLGYISVQTKSDITSRAPRAVTLAQATESSVSRFAPVERDEPSHATTALYEREVARGVEDGEEVFTGEEELSTLQPQWAGKYKPRKPRYFNRVQMGYEWNKYNQTHYDHDNLPPKVVQGYKFNVFYPDLIDKAKAPTYKIVRENGRKRGQSFAPAGEDDTCLIRFIAGPPYEDIAFRIVDKEWDYSAKRERGFRSSFDKGILQLHFQFKKIYYRK